MAAGGGGHACDGRDRDGRLASGVYHPRRARIGRYADSADRNGAARGSNSMRGESSMPGTPALEGWVDECARLTRPDHIVWCDGSEREYQELVAAMVRDGGLVKLNESSNPNSYLYRSDRND